MNKRLVLPILNSSATFLRGPAHYLDSETRIDKLTDTDFGLLAKTPAEYAERLKVEHRCLFFTLPSSSDAETAATQVATRARYVLNHFMADHPLLLQFAILIEQAGSSRPRLSPISFSEDQTTLAKVSTPYKIKQGVKREDISGFYSLVNKACKSYKKMDLTLSRFNSALTRSKMADKIIDATISLESMVQDDKNELSFKFALFNSYAGTKDHALRRKNFELLRKLYNTRSMIVHGASDDTKESKLVSEIQENWSAIEDVARRSINEFLFYANDNDAKTWTSTLIDRILQSQKQEEAA